MIFFNLIGALWVIVGFGVAVRLQEMNILPYGDDRFFIVAAVLIFILDISYRLFITKKKIKNKEDNALKTDVLTHWLLGPRMGGSLMFLPAWACSVLVPIWFVYIVTV